MINFYDDNYNYNYNCIRDVNPSLVHRVSPELQHLFSVALSKNISLRYFLVIFDITIIINKLFRPYVNEMRYHCWVTEESLEDYLEKGIVYQSEG